MVRRARRPLSRAAPSPTRLILPEYQPVRVPRSALDETRAGQIWEQYGQQIRVEFPSPATNDHWQLTALGWVGLIPLGSGQQIELAPKLPLANLFRLLEYAYDLTSYRLLDGHVRGATLPELYAHLAGHLAHAVMKLARAGLAQDYVPRTADTTALRGRLNIAHMVQQPHTLTLPCTFAELQVDIPENQILAGALLVILRSGLCDEPMLSLVRQAWQILAVTVTPWYGVPPPLVYTRRTAPYQQAHALSRLFLAHCGPAWGTGETATIPFLVNMARLFEHVVAAWLQRHAPPTLLVQTQERLPLNPAGDLAFVADIILRDRCTGQPLAVLDTKYTVDPLAETADIAQVAAYAAALDATQGYLVYPTPLAQPLDVMVGTIHVQSAVFALDDKIDHAGAAFMGQVAGAI